MGRFTIILVVGFAIIAGGLKLNHGRLSRQAQEISTERYLEQTARNITTSGVNLCLQQISQNFNWRSGFNNLALNGGSVSCNIVDSSVDSNLTLNQLRITATGTYAGKSTTAVVLMAKSAFSEFAYFTNVEPLIYFITGDTLKGPIHTNGQFHISGDPVFYGLVSSVASSWYGSGHPQFKGGTNFGCPNIQLPTDLSILEGQAQNGGTSFQGNVNLEFLNNGTFNWEVFHTETQTVKIKDKWVTITNTVIDSSGNVDIAATNGVIATENGADVHVKGILDGQVTVLSEGNIWIEDDIVYKQNPLTDYTADDLLGLISKNNIYVADNAANQNNCIINATLMALNTSFSVQNYNTGTLRGTLTIVGGIVQNQRGPVGTMRGGIIKTGYLKKYIYDQRFLTQAPPNYPVFSRTSVISWYE